MKFIIQRDDLLKKLQSIIHLITARPVMPILSNILLEIRDKENLLKIIGTNLEIEIITTVNLIKKYYFGTTTIPAKKFFNICRSLPEKSNILISLKSGKLVILCKSSKFILSTLPVEDFPHAQHCKNKINFLVPQEIIRNLFGATYFAMANQDVRHYLNGILLENKGNKIRAVASDGYRLSIYFILINKKLPSYSIIIPRNSIIELMRLLKKNNENINIQIGFNNIRISTKKFTFISKLIDGDFPDYELFFNKKYSNFFVINKLDLKNSLLRVAILSNEQFNCVNFIIYKNKLKINSNNLFQETAEETIEIIYNGPNIEICFNIKYLLDILKNIKSQDINFLFNDADSNVQIENEDIKNIKYILMPVRI